MRLEIGFPIHQRIVQSTEQAFRALHPELGDRPLNPRDPRQRREVLHWLQIYRQLGGNVITVDPMAGPRVGEPIISCPLQAEDVPSLYLHLDADRDGVVDNDVVYLDQWTWGPAGRGAIVVCNNDDDDNSRREDNSDGHVNGAGDELVPFEIRRFPGIPFPAGWSAVLSLQAPVRLRIFDAAGNELIHPGTPTRGAVNAHQLANIDLDRQVFWVEATRYANAVWDGMSRISLTVLDNNGIVQAQRHGQLKVAPWMMTHHLVPPETVFATDLGGGNVPFLQTLFQVTNARGVQLDTTYHGDDIWMQDCMEFGQQTAPTLGLRTVAHSPRRRGLANFPQMLLARDAGYVRPGQVPDPTTYDSAGNLEVTPPYTDGNGRRYPFGRIYYCRGDHVDRISTTFERFLERQEVQRPLPINASFMNVGHVDEIISFVPSGGSTHGWRLVVASPFLAYEIMAREAAAGRGGQTVLTGRQLRNGTVLQRTIAQVLAETRPDPLGRGGMVELTRFNVGGVGGVPPINGFSSMQQELDAVLVQLVSEMALALPATSPLQNRVFALSPVVGMAAALRSVQRGGISDVIELPVVLAPNVHAMNKADAYTVNPVNMVVLNNDCIVPLPYGPNTIFNIDLFAFEIWARLHAAGMTVHWIDTFSPYHVAHGGAHCGSNTRRQYQRWAWWEHQP